MNVYGKDILVNAKMGKILLESEVIKNNEYEWLKNILEKDENHTIKYSQLEELDESKRTFMTSSLFKNLYSIASDEWEIDHLDEDTQKMECSLCGEKNTIKKYYIKNKKSNKVLNVGSTCITNFKDIKGVNGKSKEEIDKEWEKQQRQKILNDRYNGIIYKIENWNRRIDEIQTIVNARLEEEYDKIYSEIQIYYKKFIKNKNVDYLIADKINKLVCQGDEILNKINIDIKSKESNEWFITKEIKEWCLKNKDENQIVIKFLKEDGIIEWRSACRIYEKNFIEKMLKKLEISLSNSNIKLIGFNEKNNCIIVNLIDGNPYTARIDLNCSYNSFMKEFGYTIFDKDTNNKFIDAKEFLIINSSIIDEASLEISVNNIKFLLSKTIRKIYKWDIRYNEIVFFEENNKYCVVELKKFINAFKECVFNRKLDVKQIENINNYVIKNGEKISKEEYENRIEMREKVDKSMQTDYSKFV